MFFLLAIIFTNSRNYILLSDENEVSRVHSIKSIHAAV
jgi:hypothetical protein